MSTDPGAPEAAEAPDSEAAERHLHDEINRALEKGGFIAVLLGVSIIASEDTVRLAGESLRTRSLGPVTVRGRSTELPIYGILEVCKPGA
jgi:hypothetical protein